MKKIIRNSFYLALLIISMFIISCAKKNAENGKKEENKNSLFLKSIISSHKQIFSHPTYPHQKHTHLK